MAARQDINVVLKVVKNVFFTTHKTFEVVFLLLQATELMVGYHFSNSELYWKQK